MIIDNEDMKNRYQKNIYKLKTINRKIEILNNSISDLQSIIGKSILIDGLPYNHDVIGAVKDNLVMVSEEISGNIIPSLINKIL